MGRTGLLIGGIIVAVLIVIGILFSSHGGSGAGFGY
jgi:hypothetical protein